MLKTLFAVEMFALLLLLISMTSGSLIVFDSSPPNIQTLLTRQMVMRCSLNDTTPTNGIVGRDVTHTSDNVHVTSLVITRNNGEHVATVTPFAPASGHVDQQNLKVNGTVNGLFGQQGYLELVWTNPTKLQGGDYKCEANAIDDQGHNVVFSQTLAVDVSAPTLDNLVTHVYQLESNNINLKEQLNLLGDKARAQDLLTQNLTSQVHALELDNNMLKIRVDQIAQALNQSHQHVETGIVDCKNNGNWAQDSSYHIGKVPAQFSTPYISTPIIHYALVNLDYEIVSGEDNPDYFIYLENAGKNGFTMVCKTYNDINVLNMKVSWVSFPH